MSLPCARTCSLRSTQTQRQGERASLIRLHARRPCLAAAPARCARHSQGSPGEALATTPPLRHLCHFFVSSNSRFRRRFSLSSSRRTASASSSSFSTTLCACQQKHQHARPPTHRQPLFGARCVALVFPVREHEPANIRPSKKGQHTWRRAPASPGQSPARALCASALARRP